MDRVRIAVDDFARGLRACTRNDCIDHPVGIAEGLNGNMVDDSALFSREELLRGNFAPGRQASTLLFAIESRTALLVAQAQRATAPYLTRKAVKERELEFLEAIASGRQFPQQPKIQDIERYAPNWADLVVEIDDRLRCALAFALGEKYRLFRPRVPNIRKILSLDRDEVEQTFQHLYEKPLTSIYVQKIPINQHLRWVIARAASWLEALPTFLVAMILTLPLGSGLLALPIALAEVGPVWGVVLLVVFGLISIVTTAALAEAVARSGTARFGFGYLGQLVADFLGQAGSIFLSATLIIDSFLVLIIFYLGVADTLEGASHLPAELWIIAQFGVGLYYLSRKSHSATVAASFFVGGVNLALVVILPMLALPYIRPAYFTINYAASIGAVPFDASMFHLIFGVLISSYSSHLLVANYGRVILRRDPGARAWIWGCITAIVLATLVSCLWVITLNGSLPAESLASETGTAMTVLAALVGPVANWLGSTFVVLSLGVGCIHLALSLFFLVDERLPTHSKKLPPGRYRFLLCAIPVVLAFLVAEWLSINNLGSFAGLLGYVGVMTLPMIAGVFPVLLLAATRRKGDIVPKLVLKILGHPLVLIATYILFVGSIFLHGAFGFEGLLQQAIILIFGCAALVVTGMMLRQKALARRLVIEVRQDQITKEPPFFSLTAVGKPAPTDARLCYSNGRLQLTSAFGYIFHFDALHSLQFDLPSSLADELKVWVHKITPYWSSEGLPAGLTMKSTRDDLEMRLPDPDGVVVMPMAQKPLLLEINFHPQTTPGRIEELPNKPENERDEP